ncbi:rhodanese-like domain-containing protein [Rubritalea spongiae]|uniref:Rhodanese-like domain-containing protein n=1 Tax=Rubritalea spongiae TaxID=430797 RepID=A0ABW5E6J0_9BACT
MRWVYESLALVLISAVAAGGIYLLVGAPDHSVPCVQAELKADQVCLETVMSEWNGDVLWVDARSDREYRKGHLPEALLISETDAENQIAVPETMERIGMAGVEGRKLVVYCGTDACGSSELVAEKIRTTGFHSEVYVLFGGWKAVMASGVSVVTP